MICEKVTLLLFAQIVQQLQSLKRIIIFDVKIYNLFSLNLSCVVYSELPACTKNIIHVYCIQKLIISYSVYVV